MMTLPRSFSRGLRAASLAVLAGAGLVACAAKSQSDPVPVTIAVEFPSAPAAVVTESLRVFVFDHSNTCADLLGIRKAGRPLPTAIVERQATPCSLGAGTTIELQRDEGYTVLVAAEVGDRDFLVGCASESEFGNVKASSVELTYSSIDFTLSTLEKQSPGSTTRCGKLSDKCNNSCK